MVPYPQPIPDGAIDLTPIDPGFTRDFDSTLGNAATDTDGFDAMFAGAVNGIADLPDLHAAMDMDLHDAASAMPDVATPWEQSFGDTLAAAVQSGDPDFKQYEVHLSGGNPPTSGGGSGGSGGPGCQGSFYF